MGAGQEALVMCSGRQFALKMGSPSTSLVRLRDRTVRGCEGGLLLAGSSQATSVFSLFSSYLFWFVGWPAIGRADPRSHGFGCKHDHSRLLFQPGAVYGAGVPRTHRQSGACEALSSCHPEALSAVDRKAGNWEKTNGGYKTRKQATQ